VAIIDVLTTSRATLALAGGGYALLYVLSTLRCWNSQKLMILLMGLAVLIVLTPVTKSSFERRFAAEASMGGLDDFDERAAFERAAAMVLADHPLGAGPNHYAVVAPLGGYNLAAGVPQVAGENDAFVHNIYWLVAAETGYAGIITFILLLLAPLIVAFRCSWQNRRHLKGDVLLGLGVALLVVYTHSLYEWIFIGSEAQYVFVIVVGMVANLARQLGYWQNSHASGRRRPIREPWSPTATRQPGTALKKDISSGNFLE
jgi:O-antigen ligase